MLLQLKFKKTIYQHVGHLPSHHLDPTQRYTDDADTRIGAFFNQCLLIKCGT